MKIELSEEANHACLSGDRGSRRALRRLRQGSLKVRVEHVNVNEGGQAVIGNVRSGTAGEGPPSSRMTMETGKTAKLNEQRNGRGSFFASHEITGGGLARIEKQPS